MDARVIGGDQATDPSRLATMLQSSQTPADFDRSNPTLAEAVAERLYPDPDIRTACLALLADSIDCAHAVNAASWGVTLFPDHIRLNVDGIETNVLLHDRLYVVVDTDVLPDTALSTLGAAEAEYGRPTDTSYSTFPTARKFWTAASNLSRLREEAWRAHAHLVEHAARTVRVKCHFHHTHSPGVVRYLRRELGRDVPEPAYSPTSVGEQPQEHHPKPSFDSDRSSLSAWFAAAGLHYDPWQIASFYTALQTKGFVILSGISGTGKSKLAQAFAAMLPTAPTRLGNAEGKDRIPDVDEAWASEELTDTAEPVRVTARGYMLQHKFFVVPKAAYGFFNPPLAGTSGEIDVYYGPNQERCRLRHRLVRGGPQSLLELLLRGSLREWFGHHVSIGDEFAVAPEWSTSRQVGVRLITKGTEQNPRSEPEQTTRTEPHQGLPLNNAPNALFLPVRPDWRDSKSLLGYHNPLTDRYEWTPFLRFLLRAAASFEAADGLAWFVILDEMNLAHVEHYFADLLSVLESGRDETGWTREPLRLAAPISLAPLDPGSDPDQPPAELRLPPNLYVVGTVNVDETTHAFSPKVLDRAFTLDLTEVDFTAYPPTPPANPSSPLTDADRQALLAAFTDDDRFPRVDKAQIASHLAAHPEVRDRLQRLNDLLHPHALHFGYRVFDEIVTFLAHAERNRRFAGLGPDAAFDAAALMKVLPKFHGSRAKLEAPLRAVLAWSLNPDAPDDFTVRERLDAPSTDTGVAIILGPFPEARLRRTADRVSRMLTTLYANGFAAF